MMKQIFIKVVCVIIKIAEFWFILKLYLKVDDVLHTYVTLAQKCRWTKFTPKCIVKHMQITTNRIIVKQSIHIWRLCLKPQFQINIIQLTSCVDRTWLNKKREAKGNPKQIFAKPNKPSSQSICLLLLFAVN